MAASTNTTLIRAKKAELQALQRVAETGEQHAEICTLAEEIVALGGAV